MRVRGEVANSLSVKDDRICGTGNFGTTSGKCIDLHGLTIIPGFCDAHTHFYDWAVTRDRIDLLEAKSLEAALELIRESAATCPQNQWIMGCGFYKDGWKPATFPDRHALDRVTPRHAAAIISKDQHSYWVNSEALKRAGITRDTPDPTGGRIERDEHGDATGMLFEEAYKLVADILPDPDARSSTPLLDAAAADVHRLGVTSIHDMGGPDVWNAYSAWQKPRIDVVSYLPVALADEIVASGLKSGDGSATLIIGGLKLFTDGALGSQTAYMWEPYAGSDENVGISRMSPSELCANLEYAVAHHLACAIHAIGDRANSEVIDCALKFPAHTLRHRLEHAQAVRPEDIASLARSKWIASPQPSHLMTDRDTAERLWGARRSAYAFPLKSMLDAGIPLAFGSDVSIEPVDPMGGLFAACCRKHPADTRGPWGAAEVIDRYSALHAFTAGAAYAAGQENEVGILTPDRRANFVILDSSPLDVSDDRLTSIKVLATFHAGEPVYVHPDAPRELNEL